MDAQYVKLKRGLDQFSDQQLQKVLDHPHEMVLDEFYYHDGRY